MCSLHIQAPGGHIQDFVLSCRLGILGAAPQGNYMPAGGKEVTLRGKNLGGCLDIYCQGRFHQS